MPVGGHRLAILGDQLEVADDRRDHAAHLHREVADVVARLGFVLKT